MRTFRNKPGQLVNRNVVIGAKIEAGFALHAFAQCIGNTIKQRRIEIDRKEVKGDVVFLDLNGREHFRLAIYFHRLEIIIVCCVVLDVKIGVMRRKNVFKR